MNTITNLKATPTTTTTSASLASMLSSNSVISRVPLPQVYLSNQDVLTAIQGHAVAPLKAEALPFNISWRVALIGALFFGLYACTISFMALAPSLSTIDHSGDQLETFNVTHYPRHGPPYIEKVNWTNHTNDFWVPQWQHFWPVAVASLIGCPLTVLVGFLVMRTLKLGADTLSHFERASAMDALAAVEIDLLTQDVLQQPYRGEWGPIIDLLAEEQIQQLSFQQQQEIYGQHACHPFWINQQLSHQQELLCHRVEMALAHADSPTNVAAILDNRSNQKLFNSDPYAWAWLVRKLPSITLNDQQVYDAITNGLNQLIAPPLPPDKALWDQVIIAVHREGISLQHALKRARKLLSPLDNGKTVDLLVAETAGSTPVCFTVSKKLLFAASEFFEVHLKGKRSSHNGERRFSTEKKPLYGIPTEPFSHFVRYLHGIPLGDDIDYGQMLYIADYCAVAKLARAIEKKLLAAEILHQVAEEELLELASKYNLKRLHHAIDAANSRAMDFQGRVPSIQTAAFTAQLKCVKKYQLPIRLQLLTQHSAVELNAIAEETQPLAPRFFKNIQKLFAQKLAAENLKGALFNAISMREYLLKDIWEAFADSGEHTNHPLASTLAQLCHDHPHIALANWTLPPRALHSLIKGLAS
jgi:hypothetical protein